MKTRQLTLIMVIASCLLAIFSCRKELEFALLDRQNPADEIIESAQIWYFQRLTPKGLNNGQTPEWKDSWEIKELSNKSLIVPISKRHFSDAMNSKKFFVFDFVDSRVKKGRIIEFVSEEEIIGDKIDFLIRHCDSDYIEGYDGYIIHLDVNQNHLNGFVYAGGRKVNHKEVINGSVSISELMRSDRRVTLSDDDCPEPPPPTLQGFPSDMCDNGTVDFDQITIKDPEGCVISTTWVYKGHYCPGEGSGGGSGAGGGGLLFVIPSSVRANYPDFAELIENIVSAIAQEEKVMNALKYYTQLSEAQIMSHLQNGGGPVIKVVESSTIYGYGAFNAANPNELKISKDLVEEYEYVGDNLGGKKALAFLLAATILHEYVHFGRNMQKLDDTRYEYGWGFESMAFGVIINRSNAEGNYYEFFEE